MTKKNLSEEQEKWMAENKKRREEAEKYRTMTPEEKVHYNLDNMEKLLKSELGELGCMAGRDYCIECGLQEIRNALKKMKED